MARFCTRCGKPLEDGEVCSCMQQAAPVGNTQMNTQAPQGQGWQNAPNEGQQAAPNRNPGYGQAGPNGNTGYGQAGPNGNPGYGQAGPNGNPGYGQAGPNGNPGYGQVPPNPGQYRQYQQYQRRNGGIQGADVAAEAKNVAAKALELFKRPVTAAKQFTNPNSIMGIELIGAKAVLSLIVVILVTAILFGKVNKLAGGYMGSLGIKAPYFALIVTTLLMTAGMDFLDALLLKVLSKSQRLNYKCMTINVSVRVVYELMGTAIGGLFLILGSAMLSVAMLVIGLVVIAGFSVIPPYAQFAAYFAVVDNREDSKVFRYIISKVLLAVATSLTAGIMAGRVVSQFVNSIGRYLF